MKKRKKGYTFLLILTILFTLAAVLTIVPLPSAGKESFLNYKALCPFTPISTLILIVLAGVICLLRKRKLTEKT